MIDAAQIMDMIGKLIPLSLLAGIAMAVIHFFRSYMEVCVQYYIVLMQIRPFLICSYARKRVVIRVVHDCRDTVFPRNPDSHGGLSGK